MKRHTFPIQIGQISFFIFLDEGFYSESDWGIGIHNHSDYELHIILKGSETLYLGARQYTFDSGSVYLIEPGIYHEQLHTGTAPLHKHCLRFQCRKPPHPSEEDMLLWKILTNFQVLSMTPVREEALRLLQILSELQKPQFATFSLVQAHFTALFIFLFRSFLEHEPALRNTEEDERGNLIDAFFAFHYAENPKLKELAELLHVSESQANRILLHKYKVNFRQKLLSTKMEAAKALLSSTCLSIATIAAKVGYDETANFSNIFRRKTGYSPSAYRLRQKFSSQPLTR